MYKPIRKQERARNLNTCKVMMATPLLLAKCACAYIDEDSHRSSPGEEARDVGQ